MKRRFPIYALVLFLASCSETAVPTTLPEAAPTIEMLCDGGPIAHVFTWNDINGDGIRDQNEPPLPYITFNIDRVTNSEGEGGTGYWVPGCCEFCWKGESVSVEIPPGYVSTTPTDYPLTGDDDEYFFGFKLDNEDSIITFPNEPEWYTAFTNRGLLVSQFHYTDNHVLLMSANLEETLKNDAYYDDRVDVDYYYERYIFSVTKQLIEENNIIIERIEVTLEPSGVKLRRKP